MKINTSAIDGYDNMTAEEKLNAILNADFTDEKLKSAFEKTASEVASYKKKLQEKMTDDERKAEERAEWEKNLTAQLEEANRRAEKAERENVINHHKASYLANGYDEKLAESSAKAMADGNTAQLFADLKAYTEAREKAIRAELLAGTPKPEGAGGAEVVTKESFLKMTSEEQKKYVSENPNWKSDLK